MNESVKTPSKLVTKMIYQITPKNNGGAKSTNNSSARKSDPRNRLNAFFPMDSSHIT